MHQQADGNYRICTMFCVVFFFQAEDGIRDRNVTGVQTCALPISNKMRIRHAQLSSRFSLGGVTPGCIIGASEKRDESCACRIRILFACPSIPTPSTEIGRASCRARAWMSVGARLVRETVIADRSR